MKLKKQVYLKMNNINFDPKNYKYFKDYNFFMAKFFNITCSLCDSYEISFVTNQSPIPIGSLIKKQTKKLSEKEVEQLINEQIVIWDKLEENNYKKNIPTFLCDECWNTLTNQCN
ncbi:hypothetical protein MNF30_03040 [Mycoplasma mycoides subsp. capri]|uniref:hypothetical protein n=1 Tax=Mycoplasma mycoides TaxID=2102 RepID=UPI00223FA194|nr:hypothetical protein [Mycoplasma mycoides]UZK63917.1 hypothetical protein MNF30_03040 [Mycoplasma mycoides subsp. capri]